MCGCDMKVSFIILSYNNARFLEQAIQSVIDQDYADCMQIIVSDDASTDDSWTVMQSIASQYKGRHDVIMRRNKDNLGICSNLNEAFKLSIGDWIFQMAGDDFAQPNLVSLVMRKVTSCKNVKIAQTWLNEVDESGNVLSVTKLNPNIIENDWVLNGLDKRVAGEQLVYHGAGMSYSRDVIDFFPALAEGTYYEDTIISLRGELLGQSCMLKVPLVNHTNHSGQITHSSAAVSPNVLEERRRKRMFGSIVIVKQNISDVKLANECGRISSEVADKLNTKLIAILNNEILKKNTIYYAWPWRLYYLLVWWLRPKETAMSKDDLARALFPFWIYVHVLQKLRAVSKKHTEGQ